MIKRKRSKLESMYSKQRKRPRQPLAVLTQQMVEMNAMLTYGSPSVSTWRQACEASLRASRARRGKRA